MKRRSGDRENRRKGKSLFPASPLSRFSGSRFSVPGFKAAGIACGIKHVPAGFKQGKNGNKDLAMIYSESAAVAAAVFTKNKVKAAPVLLDMQRLKKGLCQAIIINSGNANACTGKKGMEDAARMAATVEDVLGIKKGFVMVASTGVIGQNLPIDKIEKGISKLVSSLSAKGWNDAVHAIMTTDAFPKAVFEKCRLGGKEISVLGIAKGAGMICPDMATMLAFLATDAAIEQKTLQAMLKLSVDNSFNCITVDGDTSTNDTVLILANGKAGNKEVRSQKSGVRSKDYKTFSEMLERACLKLAKMVVMDGEGSTKLLKLHVSGAKTDSDAKKIAETVANSPLVKTAFFGEDANWGRIMAAIGRSGADMKQEKINVYFNNVPVVMKGQGAACKGQDREKMAAKAVKQKEVCIRIELGMGRGIATVWASDLSYEYVRINAAYRT
ncbi:MAG: bifunctional glutamate N-acetyltransferase/amino-acid acetyltransferase ArgJ [Deltaproteobacteria bacterium]|nr:bifunctional glutamate N-acetyltransferase/amino-acid acetyltransferase ArgJ [Deltaproteobacteria bacterium]